MASATTVIGIGTRSAYICILLWFCLLIRPLQCARTSSQAISPRDYYPQHQINTSTELSTLSIKQKRSQSYMAEIKQHHDKLLRQDEYKDYELFKISFRISSAQSGNMRPSQDPSISPNRKPVQIDLQYFRPRSRTCVQVSVIFKAQNLKFTRPRGFDDGLAMSPFRAVSMILTSKRRSESLVAPFLPLRSEDGIWDIDLTHFYQDLAEAHQAPLPPRFYLNDVHQSRRPSSNTEIVVQRQPRAFALLAPRISDPTPCTFEVHYLRREVVIGAFEIVNQQLKTSEKNWAPYQKYADSPVDRWPVWLQKHQGTTPAWNGEIVPFAVQYRGLF